MITNKEYVEDEGEKCPSCGDESSQMGMAPTDANKIHERIKCMTCGATWWEVYILARYEELEVNGEESNPPDPNPVVVIEVDNGVASILQCPEWIETVIVDKDTQPAWPDISHYHLSEMTNIGLTNLRIEVNRERVNIGETITLQLLELIRRERVRRRKDAIQ